MSGSRVTLPPMRAGTIDTSVGRNREARLARISAAARYVILSAWALYFVVPVYWLIVASTKSAGTLYSSPALVPAQPQVARNLANLFSYDGGIFIQWVGNSALYAVVGAAVGTLVAGMAGYYLALFQFRASGVLFRVVVTGMLIPFTALALPLFLMFARIGITNTIWAVLLPSIVSPFSLYLCRVSASASVPKEILEAARLDGARDLRIFVTIGSRLMLPGLVTSFLAQFVGNWNNMLLPLVMLQNQRLYPLTVGLFIWQGQINHAPILQTLILVGALVSVVPLVIVFLLLQRYWRQGLTVGGVNA